MTDALLLAHIQQLPEALKREAWHYIEFLRTKSTPVPPPAALRPDRVPGSAAGRYVMADDFNEPLDDFKEHM